MGVEFNSWVRNFGRAILPVDLRRGLPFYAREILQIKENSGRKMRPELLLRKEARYHFDRSGKRDVKESSGFRGESTVASIQNRNGKKRRNVAKLSVF